MKHTRQMCVRGERLGVRRGGRGGGDPQKELVHAAAKREAEAPGQQASRASTSHVAQDEPVEEEAQNNRDGDGHGAVGGRSVTAETLYKAADERQAADEVADVGC